MTSNGWVRMGLLASLLAGCGVFSTRGDGTSSTLTLSPTALTAVRYGHGIEGTYTAGEVGTVTLEGEGNLLDLLELRMEGTTLVVDEKGLTAVALSPTRPITLAFSAPKLSSVDLSGAATFTAERLDADGPLEVDGSGSSRVQVRALAAGALDVELSGASELHVTGSAETLVLGLSGDSRLEGALSVGTAQVSLSGGSSAELTASRSVSGDASGGSTLTVHGDGRVDVSTSGGSRVVRE